PRAVPASIGTSTVAPDHHAAAGTGALETAAPFPSPAPGDASSLPAEQADAHASHMAGGAHTLRAQPLAATRPEGVPDGGMAFGIAAGFGLGVCASLVFRRRPSVRLAEGP
ncbi:MAG: hypothetical protein ACRDJO_07270, partial [Actinomycetota bacterium]